MQNYYYKKMIKIKEKMLISGCVLVLLALSTLAIVEDDSEKIAENLLLAKKDNLMAAMIEFDAKMTAAISVAEQKSLDVSKLEIIQAEFAAQEEILKNATLDGTVTSVRSEAIRLAQEFRDAAKEIGLKAYEDDVNDTEKTEIEKVKNQTDLYTQQAADARLIGLLNFYDQHIAQVEKIINSSKSVNVSTTLIEQKLQEFKGLKPQLVAALNSRDKDAIQEAMKNLKDKWKEIGQAIVDTYNQNKLEKTLNKAQAVMNRLDVNLQKLKTAGIGTAVLEQQIKAFNNQITSIQGALNAQNLTGAQELASGLQDKFKNLTSTYDQTRKEKTKGAEK
jgi:hypothetical protein